jgi:hypothetical protein
MSVDINKELTTMDRQKIRALNVAIEKALQQVGNDFGVNIRTKGARYDATSAKVTLEVADVNGEGVAETREFRVLKLHYPGLAGKRFEYQGKVIELTGYNPRAKRYPLQYTVVKTGARYKAGEYLAEVLKRAPQVS